MNNDTDENHWKVIARYRQIRGGTGPQPDWRITKSDGKKECVLNEEQCTVYRSIVETLVFHSARARPTSVSQQAYSAHTSTTLWSLTWLTPSAHSATCAEHPRWKWTWDQKTSPSYPHMSMPVSVTRLKEIAEAGAIWFYHMMRLQWWQLARCKSSWALAR